MKTVEDFFEAFKSSKHYVVTHTPESVMDFAKDFITQCQLMQPVFGSQELTLIEHLKTVEYEAWGHQAVMLWTMNGKWHSGLRNNKRSEDNRFSGNTLYEAALLLYEYCLKNGFVEPFAAIQSAPVVETNKPI